MAPGSRARRSPRVNPPADPTGEQNELAGQGPIQGFNAGSDKASTEALTPPEAPTPPLVPPSTKDLFTKFHESVHRDDAGSSSGTSRATKTTP